MNTGKDFVRHWLRVITWVGTSVFYAQHYHASIVNEHGSEVFRGPVRKSEKSAMTDAVKWAKGQKNIVNFILFLGEYAVCDPMKTLVGPKDLKLSANRLWEEFEKLGGWYQGHMRDRTPHDKQHDKVCEQISEKWNALFGIHYT